MFGMACSGHSRLHDPELRGRRSKAPSPMVCSPPLRARPGANSVMEHLRHPSPRPAVVVDPAAYGVVDPIRTFIGRPAPLGRERCLFALPLDPGPALVSPPTVLRDPGSAYVADPEGALIGVPAVWIGRILTARWTEDTRRLG